MISEKEDPILLELRKITNRLDVLIAFNAMQTNRPDSDKIKLLKKFGLGYDEIQNTLSVSPSTISKVQKGKVK